MISVYDAVAELENTGDIPTLLVMENIRGKRNQSSECPIALFIQKRTGIRVMVGPSDVSWVSQSGKGWYKEIILSSRIADVIRRIDRGDYPSLLV